MTMTLPDTCVGKGRTRVHVRALTAITGRSVQSVMGQQRCPILLVGERGERATCPSSHASSATSGKVADRGFFGRGRYRVITARASAAVNARVSAAVPLLGRQRVGL
jgi:hypothetical protein